MAWNVPSYSVKRLSFGPAVVFVGAVGTTPSATATNDIGAVKGDVGLTISREYLEVYAGNPAVLIAQWVTKQLGKVNFTSLEAATKFALLVKALGAGVTTGSDGVGTETFGYGGNPNMTECALEIRHVTPTGMTLQYCFWRCQGKADFSQKFTDANEPFGVPMEFAVLDGQTDWAGAAIASSSNERLFRIYKVNPPA